MQAQKQPMVQYQAEEGALHTLIMVGEKDKLIYRLS